MLGRVIFISAALGAGGWCLHRWQRRKVRDQQAAEYEAAERARRLDEALSGVWSERRPLIADIESDLNGPGKERATSSNGRLVEVNLTPGAQRGAWMAAKYYSGEGINEDPEATARMILESSVCPDYDWRCAAQAPDPRLREVYDSVQMLFEIAELSLKYGAVQDRGKGGLICPGWVHEKPAATADIRPGDYLRVLVDTYSADPDLEPRYAEWAWVRVEGTDAEQVRGSITAEAPPGSEIYHQRHTDRHGFGPGTAVVMPRRCVFEVVPGK